MISSLTQRYPFLIRLLNWEYWPTQVVYIPLFIYFFWLWLRGRQPYYFTAANPGIFGGGMGAESKFATLQKIPAALRPRTVLVTPDEPHELVMQKLAAAAIVFPLIAKPDIGFRGLLVRRIADQAALEAYLAQYPLDFILQELLEQPLEVGVFYYRLPNEKHGVVSSITLKEFPSVVGDGKLTVLELVKNNPRVLLQLERLRDTHAAILSTIPAAGQRVNLGLIGNHSKGTKFIDGCHLITPALVANFDRINEQMEGIYYGRFDLKCQSLDDLITGHNLKVIELNGVCSEPTHMYDPRHSFFYGVRQVARHWHIITQISKLTRQNGFKSMSVKETIQAMKALKVYANRVKAFAKAN